MTACDSEDPETQRCSLNFRVTALKCHRRQQTDSSKPAKALSARQKSHLLQLPVELCWSEGVHLGEVSPQQEHQAAVVDVQRVMMTVHLCGRKESLQTACHMLD